MAPMSCSAPVSIKIILCSKNGGVPIQITDDNARLIPDLPCVVLNHPDELIRFGSRICPRVDVVDSDGFVPDMLCDVFPGPPDLFHVFRFVCVQICHVDLHRVWVPHGSHSC